MDGQLGWIGLLFFCRSMLCFIVERMRRCAPVGSSYLFFSKTPPRLESFILSPKKKTGFGMNKTET